MVSAVFRFESGVHGTGAWCFSAFERRDWTEIVGTEGRIGYATFGDWSLTVTTSAGQRELHIEVPRHIQQGLIQTIVNDLNGQGSCSSTGESAARTAWVMDGMLDNYRARGPNSRDP